jgi:NitT/TauT family transport system permease protein
MSQYALGLVLTGAGLALVTVLVLTAPKRSALVWNRSQLPRAVKLGALIGGLLVFAGLWELLHAFSPAGPTRVPTIAATINAAVQLLTGDGLLHIAASAVRVLLGFTIAALVSISLAFLFSLHSVSVAAFAPPLGFVRYIPPTAFTALLVIYFGIGEHYKVAVVFVGVFFFNFRMTLDIIEDFDIRYVELARLTGASFQRNHGLLWLLGTTVLPASGPRIWDMLRINLSFAWTFLVVAETVGAQLGLGKELYLAQRFFRVEDVYACILLFGVIGLVTDAAMAAAKRQLFRWHDDGK